MHKSMTDSHQRSFLKGVTWRIVGTVDTIFLSYIITGEMITSLKIGFTEVATKIFLYYLHERLWNIIPFGRIDGVGPTHLRSVVKGVTWRILGTIDTMVIALIITGEPINAITIGGLEVFTKVGLFYLHERVWGRLKWGRVFGVEPKEIFPNTESTAEVEEAEVSEESGSQFTVHSSR
jgi:uncharacterized membrane protein